MPPSNGEECRAVQVAKAFFQATTKLSEDNEDILPQVIHVLPSPLCFQRVACSLMQILPPRLVTRVSTGESSAPKNLLLLAGILFKRNFLSSSPSDDV